MFAVIIFIFILLGTFWAWHLTQDRIHYVRSIRNMNVVAKSAMNNIVNTQGDPIDWQHIIDADINNISTIGIMYNRKGIASLDKINRLVYLSDNYYNQTRDFLGIIGPGYEYYLEIGDRKTGNKYGESAVDVVGVDRLMMLSNGTMVKLKMRVWK